MKRKAFIMAMTACLIGASMGTTGVTMAQAAEENWQHRSRRRSGRKSGPSSCL